MRALRGRAELYAAANQWEDARKDFQSILDLVGAIPPLSSTSDEEQEPQVYLDDQEMARVRRGLVFALIGGRQYKDAVAVVSNSEHDADKKEWFARILKERMDQVAGDAIGLLEGGKFAAAVDMYGDALALEEVYVEVGAGRRKRSLRVGRAMANEALERVRVALEDYREVVAMGGGVLGLKGCGRCLLEIGELEEAYEMYNRVLIEDPTCREAIERMGLIQKHRQEVGDNWAGKRGRAVEWWQAWSKAEA